MPKPNHYTVLGLTPTAPPEVIRAAYKALCLISHPDKTMTLAPQERASHAALFKEVQAAYDVLGVPSLKAAYDAALSNHDNAAAVGHSASPCFTGSKTRCGKSSKSKRKTSIKLTTPEEKVAVRAKARQSIEYLRGQRAKREDEDSQSDIPSLKNILLIWSEIAEENRHDPAMRAHCTIRIHEYEQKIQERERQHEEWLADMSTAKQTPSKPTMKQQISEPKSPVMSNTASSTHTGRTAHSSMTLPSYNASPIASANRLTSTEKRQLAAAEKAATAAARAQARTLAKSQREAAKQSHCDQKVAAVRAEKAKQQARVQKKAQEESQRIAKARAKTGAAPLGAVASDIGGGETASSLKEIKINALMESDRGSPRKDPCAQPAGQSSRNLCSKCGFEHQNFREWRRCHSSASVGGELR